MHPASTRASYFRARPYVSRCSHVAGTTPCVASPKTAVDVERLSALFRATRYRFVRFGHTQRLQRAMPNKPASRNRSVTTRTTTSEFPNHAIPPEAYGGDVAPSAKLSRGPTIGRSHRLLRACFARGMTDNCRVRVRALADKRLPHTHAEVQSVTVA